MATLLQLMSIASKTKTVKFRVEPELFDKFSREIEYCEGASASAFFRKAMQSFIAQMHQRRKTEISNAEWAATLQSRHNAAAAAIAAQSPPVAPVIAPMSLSERRRAEKLAKAARKARREE